THTMLTKSYKQEEGAFSDRFHVFSLLWTKDSLKILIDNQIYSRVGMDTFPEETNPFHQPFYLVFNVAVGGNWPGPPDSTTHFPKRMYVDYVRVFEKK
ncbi:MAG TPA: glycoside hydrolase family 16 protein, partial [Chitinophagaceae bacterium]|nr:glycoside hydrolase family 16 protein [Chitinophagaceae bacterium]